MNDTPDFSKHTPTPQTQQGRYSDRLSNERDSGRHESFRLDENFFRQVIDSLEDYAIFTMDTQGLVSSWNGAAGQLLGYTEEEIIGQPTWVIFTEADRQAGIPQQEMRLAAEQDRALDDREHQRKDGSTFWASGLVFPLKDESGALRGFTKILRDMSKARQAQERLEESEKRLQLLTEELAVTNEELAATNEELQAANEELQANGEVLQASNQQLDQNNQRLTYRNTDLDTFVYKASHDLKAPLHNLEGLLSVFTKQIHKNGWQDPAITSILPMIQDSLVRFRQTITGLAETAKEQSGMVNLAGVVAEVQADLQGTITQSGAVIHSQVADCHTLRFPRANLKSLVYNLLSNAIKYRFPDRNVYIELVCRDMDEHIVLTIKDNGLGIRQEDIPRLFTRYERLHDHVAGTGVGLYIVKQMVENEGGSIAVESVLGEGTTFRVYFRKSA